MTKREQKFVREVWDYYRRHGRGSLPWRRTRDPYKILVSEVMLQQTQVERVLPKYTAFLKLFPTLRSLANAPLGDVLRAWQGLGYNRRAKMLHECARMVVSHHGGKFPKDYGALGALPGIGNYTAGAVMAFAFSTAVPVIETNIRSVFIHHFFSDDADVSDSDILNLVERTLDRDRVRDWYYALMDYGVYIKKTFGNPNARSKHYAKQSTFKGSDRQLRGAIIRELTVKSKTRRELLNSLHSFEDIRIDAQLARLMEEGMVEKRGIRYTL